MTDTLTISTWARDALPESIFIYFTSAPGRYLGQSEFRPLRDLAWRQYVDGKVDLLQRRLGPDRFEYRMVRRAVPPKKATFAPNKLAKVKWL